MKVLQYLLRYANQAKTVYYALKDLLVMLPICTYTVENNMVYEEEFLEVGEISCLEIREQAH